MTSYQGKVGIVTGASSGIGAAFALELAQRGAKVVLFARRAEKLAEVCRGATDCAPTDDILSIVGDVTNAADRAMLVQKTLAHFGRLDVLINNAGRGEGGNDFLHLTPAIIDEVLQTNLLSAIHLTHLAVPHIIEGGGGIIINVSSPMGKLGLPRRTLYNASKAGLSAMSQTLHRELAPYHIHVLDCLPGLTRSEMIPPEREAQLPRFLPVYEASVVAKATLDAAWRGQAEIMTGGLWLNKGLPRLGDWVARRVKT